MEGKGLFHFYSAMQMNLSFCFKNECSNISACGYICILFWGC